MDYIESLRLFRTIVEVRNFRRAGEMLDLSPSVVSRSIASLEERLGTRLFHRSTRQFSLTEAAEHFYEGCCRVLDDLDCLEASAAGRGRIPAGVLRVVAHTTTALTWLAPLMASFKRKHPNITLDITLTERSVDLTADGYDLGIVLPYMLATDLAVTRLLQRLPLVVVTTQAYLARRPPPRHPADLADHVFVTVPPSMHKPTLTFRIERENVAVPIKYEIASNNPLFNRDIILEGFGVGLLPFALVEQDIKAGRLVRLLENFEIVDTAAEVRLAYIGRTLLPAKVRAFIDHTAEFFELVMGDAPRPTPIHAASAAESAGMEDAGASCEEGGWSGL
ncbi:DNA-binding transcriptional LysR family regulator [Paraburkholderia bannensis]|uniref:DNA-binding transcriptional LysR family regulator n=1 Tax=Paraburkholderia bannensis TaxID=765414 RepID=A0A7W9TYE2_9BURK|nr:MULTISPECIES: LysR family transcriptional regulator [Paraburkholderia]MBB3258683.1 DNA-binding transcriptional LysR family regulator [Paraburkholderia sp. WP4_3_2]MBB6103697.1 DNA-binding transcriptional LysR family regulator [Paraburkholderia bannensis]